MVEGISDHFREWQGQESSLRVSLAGVMVWEMEQRSEQLVDLSSDPSSAWQQPCRTICCHLSILTTLFHGQIWGFIGSSFA